MYPAHGLALFPPFPRDNRVFVAMQFQGEPFPSRWENVIAPGIREAGLEPFRVDIPRISQSIPTEIIAGLSQSRLVFADVTAIAGHRNGNVMYEIGIAHAVRQPEEVVLFRSDHERLLFDVSTIRVNSYDPEASPAIARASVKDAVTSAMRDVDLSRARAVQNAADSIDHRAVMLLVAALAPAGLLEPALGTMGQVLGALPQIAALSRLLELGLVAATGIAVDPAELARNPAVRPDEILRQKLFYRITEFGRAALAEILRRWGMPASLAQLEEIRARIAAGEMPNEERSDGPTR
jgi:hypothetical protein